MRGKVKWILSFVKAISDIKTFEHHCFYSDTVLDTVLMHMHAWIHTIKVHTLLGENRSSIRSKSSVHIAAKVPVS